ncbi:hypothetical protein HA402_010953 [Bradysia odoriphaga]|nr:hypothetical protein HA402_010953 [Bradysia odoriphaga]
MTATFRINDLFSNYLRHNEVNEYMEYLAASYPKFVTVTECGQSYEGRTLKCIKISYNHISDDEIPPCHRPVKSAKFKSANAKYKCKRNGGNTRSAHAKIKLKAKEEVKSVVLIDGGIHGREWISVATTVYCINQLIENFRRNTHLLRKLDFLIVPIVNVDGYEYSHTNFAFWRKTRKPITDTKYIGTDCNRNFDHHWKSACSRPSKHTYRGEAPFSEPETEMLKTIMHSIKANCKFYLSLHSYAKAFMYPFGYTRKPPDNWRELHKLAKIGQIAIKEKTGSIYRCGTVAFINQHVAAGGSPDYAYGTLKIPYTMVMELAGGCFHPPATEILRIVRESWFGIRAMCCYIADL